MIPARKSRWFSAWFAGHCERRLRRSFEEVLVRGWEEVADEARSAPLLVVSNHTAWWDPLLVVWLTQRHSRLDSFALMNADNLRRLPFFGKLGAFGVERADARDGARVIRYAASLLDRPRRLVWLFAQGDERPITEPLLFQRGAARIARSARTRVVPVAIRYEMGNVERPRLLVSCGAAQLLTDARAQERAVAEQLEQLEHVVREHDYRGFVRCLAQGRSWRGALAEAMLAWLTAPSASSIKPSLPTRS